MKALVLEKNAVLKLKRVADPRIREDECLIAVQRAGVCSSDINRAFDHGAYHYPLIMGHEFSGIVKKAGARVKGYSAGDRVSVFPLIPCFRCPFCEEKHFAQCRGYDYYGSRRDGAFAEYVAVKGWNLFRIPKDVSWEKAALLEPTAVAMHALRKVSLRPPETALILGAGLMGLMLARYLGQIVRKENIYIVDRNEGKLEFARSLKINAIHSSQLSWRSELVEKTGGGVHCVFEACGAGATYSHSLEVVRSQGTVVWIGNIEQDLALKRRLVSSILRREIKIYGCWNSCFTHDRDDDWGLALNFLKTLSDDSLFITHLLRLEEGESFLKDLFQNKLKRIRRSPRVFIKAMFHLDDD